MSSRIAALFPGQGSHAVGMGMELTTAFPVAEAVYAEAENTLPGLRALIETGPIEDLTLTANQQPALVAAGVAAYRAWQEKTGLTPMVAAGHSLGEYSALVASGVLSLADALRLTRKRGTLMQQAVAPGDGAMSAIMGDPAVVAEVCGNMEGVQPANFNAPTQTVISGTAAAVSAASAELKARGLKAIPLKVSAPFHCALMAPAAAGLSPDLQAATYSPFTFPVVANVTAELNDDPLRVPDLLERQITGAVQWVETIQTLAGLGVDTFVEFGPGKVLTGLVGRIVPGARTVNVGTAADVEAFEP
ncbi:ACP S-malonyltransferase [Deinococcus humi]|uniref:Malonyl CoA-acyl carrier protein transacylase n=1 Tax=Deinococcus humi TaxID=662880 RepID=A0A7W8JX32_9DEIO|nr:ACP S-malonyltransferase [Deinococcus humi]MBB5363341.1 [acyl-carrier-protein] S-malonyltransferase [Deinococcus humi]GGO27022.1 malonyl CoA-acyl carrier protein transacylase [Deinococcus humi]